MYTYKPLIIILMTLTAIVSTGCSSKAYKSPIDTKQYVSGLREASMDGRDDLRACKFYSAFAEVIMETRQTNPHVLVQLRDGLNDELNKYKIKGMEAYPKDQEKVQFIVNMVSDMMRVLIVDAEQVQVAIGSYKEFETKHFAERHYNICLLTTTLSRSMVAAEEIWFKSHSGVERAYDLGEDIKAPDGMPDPTKPVNPNIERAKDIAIDFAIDIIRWYLRI